MASTGDDGATPVLRSPRGSLHAVVAPFATSDEQFSPWKIAFRVQFQSDKFGLRFHPAQFPDTGNGVYTIRVLELNKNPSGTGPAQQYNASIKPGQEHLQLRPGLYLTHIGDTHLLDMPCEHVINNLQSAPRPVTLRFIDVEAGVVTPHELRDSLKLDPVDHAPTLVPENAFKQAAMSPSKPGAKASAVAAAEPATTVHSPSSSSSNAYKIILLGTSGVGKSSVLAVGVHGDGAYVERRSATLEAEFGSFEIPDPDMSTRNKIKARIWDTAGQERYRAITRSHYRRADGALLVYDVAEPDSFDKLADWLKTLKETAADSLKSIMVVENKADKLPDPATHRSRSDEFVQERDVQAFCEAHGLLFARTSAKHNATAFKWEGQKIGDAFSTLLLHIHATSLARGLHAPATGAASASDTIELKASAPTETQSKTLGDCGSCGRSQ